MIQRMSRNGLIGSGICLSAVILSWAEASGADATTVNAPQQIMIEIRNQTETDLRCVMVLAHFVTQDVPIVRAGETLPISLSRLTPQNAIAYRTHGDQPMLVENLLCGQVGNWQATSVDIAINRLRADPAERFAIICTGDDNMDCDVLENP